MLHAFYCLILITVVYSPDKMKHISKYLNITYFFSPRDQYTSIRLITHIALLAYILSILYESKNKCFKKR